MQRFITHFLDYIFPLQCCFCSKFDYFSSKVSICKNCILEKETRIPTSIGANCTVCESPLIQDKCQYCNSRNIFFSRLHSIRVKGEFEKQVIQKIKFGNAPQLSNFFRIRARRLIPEFKEQNYTSIVTVPSSKKTIRKRPIPVCLPVILLFKNVLGIKVISPLIKKSKELQSGKNFRERFIHAQSAFEIKKEYFRSLSGNYLLVDDVFTTGATINEIAKILLQNGAERVDILVLVKGKL